MVLKEPAPKAWLSNFGDSAFVYQVLSWQTSAKKQNQLRSDLMEQIWYALQRIDESIPFPIRDIRTQSSPAKLPSHNFNHESLQRLLAQTDIFRPFHIRSTPPTRSASLLAQLGRCCNRRSSR